MKRLFVLLAGLCTACAASHASKPALQYSELSYESPKGEAWPEHYLKVPKTTAQYGLRDDTSVCYVELNPSSKTTLVFLHGLGSYLKFWRYQLDDFAAKGYRVVAIDMIGYGKSDKPGSFPYSTEAMANVVHEVLKALSVEDPVLVGHSMGGQVALSYAIRYPTDLKGLVLTAPAGFEKFSDKEKAWFNSVFSTALIKGSSEQVIWRSIRRNNFFRWKSDYEWLIEERVRTAKTADFDRYAYANVKSVQGLANNDFVRNNLDKVSVPTLIIHGDKDRLIPNPYMHPGTNPFADGHAKIRGSSLVTLEDCGHTVQMDCSAAYNEKVKSFLEDVSDRGLIASP